MIHARVKTVQLDSSGSESGTAFFGVATSRFVGAYFEFDPDDLTANVALSSLGRDFETASGVGHGHLIERLADAEDLVSDVTATFSDVSNDGSATVTLFLSYGR